MKIRWICSLITVCIVLFLHNSCKQYIVDNPSTASLKSASFDLSGYRSQKVYTTLDRIIIPDKVTSEKAIKPWEVTLFSKYGYGKWHYESGKPYVKKLELMAPGYSAKSNQKTLNLLRFCTMTDIHLTDKEGPAQTIEYSFIPALFPITISCYSPSMIYSTHVLNASVQTVNELNRQNPVDFVIALGDMANTSIYNEIRWFIDVLDGKTINPDSGKKDDPIPGPGNDYQDKYQAEGLAKTIPWYATIGNHDHFFNGAKPFTDKIIKNLIGTHILQLGNVFTEENALDLNTYSMGTLDGSTVNGDIIGAGVVSEMKRIPTIPSDPNRHAITKWQMMKEFSTTSSTPKGHGFNQPNLFNGCYSFEPKSDLPLKVIVLDDTMEDNDKPPFGIGYGCGSLGNGRFEWLVRQLQLGQKEGKLMIVAAHIPIGVEPPKSMLGWLDQDDQRAIITELKKYPNFMLWVSGHRHLDTVTAFPSEDKDHPENGFWEVETRSLREFPQQFRSFDIVRNSDNTISIFATNVDPDIKNNSFAAKSRSLAIAAYQTYGRSESPLSENVELVKQLSRQMEEKIARYRK